MQTQFWWQVLPRGAKMGEGAVEAKGLLGVLSQGLRYMHYSLHTEEVYVQWVKRFVHWSGMRHPREMGREEVEGFLSMLANERKVSSSTHRQALSALLFLYKEVLGVELPWLQEMGRPVPKRRLPMVLTSEEVVAALSGMQGVTGLLGRLLYGTGMRLLEGVRLRVKELDFDRYAITFTRLSCSATSRPRRARQALPSRPRSIRFAIRRHPSAAGGYRHPNRP